MQSALFVTSVRVCSRDRRSSRSLHSDVFILYTFVYVVHRADFVRSHSILCILLFERASFHFIYDDIFICICYLVTVCLTDVVHYIGLLPVVHSAAAHSFPVTVRAFIGVV